MTPETPTPFPIPEIITHPDMTPDMLSCEIDPQDIVSLMSRMSNGREATLKSIVIRGGLIPNKKFRKSLNEKTLQKLMNSPEPGPKLFDLIYKGEWSAGSYWAPFHDAITVHPDTVILVSLANLAATDLVRSIPTERRLDVLHHRIHHLLGRTLVDEIEHVFQEDSSIGVIDADVHNELEKEAAMVSSDPILIAEGMKAVAFNILIPDEQVLGLFTLARERYRLHQE